MSKIEWTDKTWNPIVGCSKVSPGCRNCYAERMARRLKAMGRPEYQSVVDEHGWTGTIHYAFHDNNRIAQPRHWKKPRRIFVCSMGDLFHESVAAEAILRVYATMEYASHHTYQVLTKRPQRMLRWHQRYKAERGRWFTEHNPHIWHGISAENQAALARRMPALLETPLPIRFVSLEPLLGPINLKPYLWKEAGPHWPGTNPPSGLHWVIVSAESGPGARPMKEDWVRSIRDQCIEAGIPFFYKQNVLTQTRRISLPELDGRTWEETP